MVREKSVDQFDQDVRRNKGYLYTTTEKLSSRMANRRLQESILELAELRGKRVVDLGCGDGTSTLEFLKEKPALLVGIEASPMAVRLAKKKAGRHKNVQFKVLDIYKAASLKQKFDVAILRGVLHHLYDPPKAILAVSRIARAVIVVEPNGYNPVLKVLEKFSKYHIEHEERSFTASQLNRWFRESGGVIQGSEFFGLVPFFCPDWMAGPLKWMEPLVEKIPLVRRVVCGAYAFKASFE